MSDLELSGGEAAFVDGFPACSPGLKRLLTEGETFPAIRLMSINPTLRAECERLEPILAEAMRGASPEGVLALVMQEAGEMGVSADPGAFQAYVLALGGCSLESIRDGMARWKAGDGPNAKFKSIFPQPTQLSIACEKSRMVWSGALSRARKALDRAKTMAAPDRKPEDVETIRELLADFRAKSMATAPARPRETPQQLAQRLRDASVTPTGPSGLSALMRERMGLGPEKAAGTDEDGENYVL